MISQISSNASGIAGSSAPSQAAAIEQTDSAAEFRQQFYADLSAVTHHSTVINSAVQVSDEAWQAMQEDPAYREQMLGLVARDLGSSYAPRPASVLIRIGASADDYRADSWPVGYDAEFYARTQDTSADTKRSERWDQYKLFQARRRAEYRMQQQAMQASAMRHAAQSAQLRQLHPGQALQAREVYARNETTSVFEGFSLWEMPSADVNL